MDTVWTFAALYQIPGFVGKLEEVIAIGHSLAEVETEIIPEILDYGYQDQPYFECFYACEFLVGPHDQDSYNYVHYDKNGSAMNHFPYVEAKPTPKGQ